LVEELKETGHIQKTASLVEDEIHMAKDWAHWWVCANMIMNS
jgi:hypothetical protein